MVADRGGRAISSVHGWAWRCQPGARRLDERLRLLHMDGDFMLSTSDACPTGKVGHGCGASAWPTGRVPEVAVVGSVLIMRSVVSYEDAEPEA
jgi:hypothetical protein